MTSKMVALDWRSMKLYQIRGLLLPLFIMLLGFYSPLAVIPMSVILLLSFSINPFAVEEKGDLNNLYLTLPVSRKDVVKGRYMLSLIMLMCGIIMGTLIMPFSNLYAMSKWYVGVKGVIALISLSVLLYSIINLCMFPILFKLGYQKGKFWGFYLPTIVFAMLFGVYFGFTQIPGNDSLTINVIDYATNHLLQVSTGMIILAVLILFLSYLLSLKVYQNRDF